MIDRNTLRNRIRAQRNALSRPQCEESSQMICKHLLESTWIKEFNLISTYLPFQNEVDINSFIQACLDQGKTVFSPLYIEGHYTFSQLTDLTLIKKGHFGISEPAHSNTFDLIYAQEHTKLWIVPGVAFDNKGNRMGMGKGYYDQFLKDATGIKLGVCYSFQLIDTIPTESWDIPMDAILTEKGFTRIRLNSC